MSISKKEQLSEKQLAILESEMQKYKKSVGLAYVLWFFLGSLGIHKFYIGDSKKGLLYLILGIVGWISILAGGGIALISQSNRGGFLAIVGLICIIALGIMLIIDLFTIPRQINNAYQKNEDKLIDQLLSSQPNDK